MFCIVYICIPGILSSYLENIFLIGVKCMDKQQETAEEKQLDLVPMYVKVSPEVKQLVQNKARLERRSLASMVEILLRESCEAKRA
jgi:hypothetical protein